MEKHTCLSLILLMYNNAIDIEGVAMEERVGGSMYCSTTHIAANNKAHTQVFT